MDSSIHLSRHATGSSAKAARRQERALIAYAAVAALLAWPLSGGAQEVASAADSVAAPGDVQIVQPSASDRYVELRRALLSDEDLDVAGRDRRRLSPEERAELHRRLRDALRNAYGQRARTEQSASAP